MLKNQFLQLIKLRKSGFYLVFLWIHGCYKVPWNAGVKWEDEICKGSVVDNCQNSGLQVEMCFFVYESRDYQGVFLPPDNLCPDSISQSFKQADGFFVPDWYICLYFVAFQLRMRIESTPF